MQKRKGPLTAKEVVELASNLRKKLTQLGVDFKRDTPVDEVPVHLADIYEVSVVYQYLLNKLLEVPASRRKQAIQLIEQMDQHLCIHLPYHLKHLSKAFDDLTEDLNRKDRSKAKKKKRRSTVL